MYRGIIISTSQGPSIVCRKYPRNTCGIDRHTITVNLSAIILHPVYMGKGPCPLSHFSRFTYGRLTYVRKIGLVETGYLLSASGHS